MRRLPAAVIALKAVQIGRHAWETRLKASRQAGVAQLVEQRIRNAKVEGSTPFTGTRY
jgi:hypothetical protein